MNKFDYIVMTTVFILSLFIPVMLIGGDIYNKNKSTIIKDKNTTEEISLICVDGNEYLIYQRGDNLAVSYTFKKCEVKDD